MGLFSSIVNTSMERACLRPYLTGKRVIAHGIFSESCQWNVVCEMTATIGVPKPLVNGKVWIKTLQCSL